MTKTFYTWEEFNKEVKNVVNYLLDFKEFANLNKIYGIPKGGLILAVALANHLPKLLYVHRLQDIDENTLIVDDISDSGKTFLSIPNIKKYKTMSLFCKDKSKFKPHMWWRDCKENEWIVFPWEPSNKEELRDGTEF